MKKMSLVASFFTLLLFACGGGAEKEASKKDDRKEQEKAEKKEEKKEKDHDHHAQEGGPDDFSGEYRAGVDEANVEELDDEGALSVAELPDELGKGKDSMEVKLKGNVTEACPKKGCWMKLAEGEEKEDEVMVRFKDYSFFVPKNSAGSQAVLEGVAFRDTVGVDELKHYAKDAGKSEEEIAEIDEPEVRLAFEATQVALKEGEE